MDADKTAIVLVAPSGNTAIACPQTGVRTVGVSVQWQWEPSDEDVEFFNLAFIELAPTIGLEIGETISTRASSSAESRQQISRFLGADNN